MAIGEVLKADKDFTKEADAAIPEAEKLGSVRVMAYIQQEKANMGD
jgi:26S proteasome regulatory subunit N5